ncbi:hypothetical protein H0I23_03270 [Cellulophaga sp. HaHaR_3_176]|nr:hypothetical protein H0I23_03270 [Cellulophaga sp. HaHaR_3_176]
MDELELLKKDWQKKELAHPKLSYNDIHGMLWKKSSSIVKWIFIISVIEFVLPHVLYLFPSAWSEGRSLYNSLGLKTPMLILTVIQYSVIFYFIYQFYKRYKEISVLDNAKNLMANIIRTRKTVKHYIVFSLALIVVLFIVIVTGIYLSPDFVHTLEVSGKNIDNISPEKLHNIKFISMFMVVGVGVILTVAIGFVYFLLYGILLKRLNRNYRELKKLEI